MGLARAIVFSTTVLTSGLWTTCLRAQEKALSWGFNFPGVIPDNLFMLVLFTGAFAFAMGAATWLISERGRLDQDNRSLALEHADLKARIERAEALLDVPDQRVVIWAGRDEAPVCRGTLPPNTGAPDDRMTFVAFGSWMTPQSAQSFEHAVERLRDRAEGFDLTIESCQGSIIEVQGRASGSHAFVRFISLAGDRAALASLEVQHTRLMQTTDTMKSLLESVPMPVWLRDPEGNLTWANQSYIAAVEASSLEAVVSQNLTLLDATERDKIAATHAEIRKDKPQSTYRGRVPATISGDRRTMDVSEIAYQGGSAGLAVDMSEVEDVQGKLRRTIESHTQTMNQLATAVAIFDEKRHLIFHNQAFESLWQLDAGLLQGEPDNGLVFDTLRNEGKIAEQPDWSKWRNGLLGVYEAMQPQEHWWLLPDGRTLRVIANPHKQGGVTWVFENVTEQLEMESRYIALTQVQGETLDHLGEAIAVFAPNGRLKLSNPSFQKLWQLDDAQVAADTPIATIAGLCNKQVSPDPLLEDNVWEELTTGITGVSDSRKTVSGRLSLIDETVVDYAMVPLPNGQSMLSFADVSASVSLEHTLKERNEALEAAERLKNAFIEHVSYEFRAPLTNIMGFAEILQQEAIGPLNDKQGEYISHISSSSNVLHSLVDNLLDLATVDAGIMELDLEEIELHDVVLTAAKSVTEQLKEQGIKLDIRHAKGTKGAGGRFVADGTRVQQVLFNLLSNAIAFSPEGSAIMLQSGTQGDAVTLRVSDSGPGVPPEEQATIFDRFESKAQAGGRRGAGLGLAIARSLVKLHGGTIELDTDVKKGASFVCRFPKMPEVDTKPAMQAAQ